jgi:heme exporter protein A
MTTMFSLEATNLRKLFNRRTIFSGVNVRLRTGDSLCIVGKNGAGKSTLVKVLLGVLSPTAGSIVYRTGESTVPPLDWHRHTGLVSPYLQLYDEFTAWENLDFIRTIRGIHVEDGEIERLLSLVNLSSRSGDQVRTYSSGMKQRLKYACALIHRPQALFFDEPTANLDREGAEIVRRVVEEQKRTGIMIVATNETDERNWCSSEIDLDTAAGGIR